MKRTDRLFCDVLATGICVVVVLWSAAAWGDTFDQVLQSSAGNVETWRVSKPNVTVPMTVYPTIRLREGDLVTVSAGGCVQTGGHGLTWKRYVDPRGSLPGDSITPWKLLPDSGSYHGTINIPGATPGFTRIKDIQGMQLTAHASGSTGYMQLGYEDDNYADNGYSDPDVGIGRQCDGVETAWVEIRIVHPSPGAGAPVASSSQAQSAQQGLTSTSTPPPPKVTDGTPPQLAAVTLTPNTLPAQGGEVTLSVRASDNVGVSSVVAIQTRPNGQQGAGHVPLVAGTPGSGEWRHTWTISGNSGSTPQAYTINVKVQDAAGNVVAAQPLQVTVAGRSTGPPSPQAPQGSQASRGFQVPRTSQAPQAPQGQQGLRTPQAPRAGGQTFQVSQVPQSPQTPQRPSTPQAPAPPPQGATAGSPEDCVPFNPNSATVANIQGSWKIVDGSHWLFDFGQDRASAERSLHLIKTYRMTQSCFVGRPNPSFTYMLVAGRAPAGSVAGEDCLAFNPATISVAQIQGDWKIVEGNSWMFSFGNKEAEARQGFAIIKRHGFSQNCYVGRPHPRFSYLKAGTAAAAAPAQPAPQQVASASPAPQRVMTSCMAKLTVDTQISNDWLHRSISAQAVAVNLNQVEVGIYNSFGRDGFVECHYKSRQGDIPNLVYRYPCPDARKEATGYAHGYSCAK